MKIPPKPKNNGLNPTKRNFHCFGIEKIFKVFRLLQRSKKSPHADLALASAKSILLLSEKKSVLLQPSPAITVISLNNINEPVRRAIWQHT